MVEKKHPPESFYFLKNWKTNFEKIFLMGPTYFFLNNIILKNLCKYVSVNSEYIIVNEIKGNFVGENIQHASQQDQSNIFKKSVTKKL